MQNSMQDVANKLIEALERLTDDELTATPEDLEREVKRANAMSSVGDTIIDMAKLQLEVVRMQNNYEEKAEVLPDLLKYEKPKKIASV